MKVVGLFRELTLRPGPSLPSIHATKGQLSKDTAKSVAAYLKSGVGVMDVMEYVQDPFDDTRGVSGGSSVVTDGEYVWREDLSYYVERYLVGLPDDFVAHALADGAVQANPESLGARGSELWNLLSMAERQ